MAVPPRMFLVHLLSGDTMSAQFNPQEISEKIDVEWAEPPIEGSSSQPLVYKLTKNHPISFELGYDEQSGRDILSGGPNLGGNMSIQKARNWLLALCYRQAGDVQVSGGAPSRVLLVWPNLFSVKCRVKSVDLVHKMFDQTNLRSTIYTAKLSMIIDSLFQSTYESVLANGTERDDASVAAITGQTF